MEIRKANLKEKFDQIKEHWSPAILAELNGQHVKLAKVKGTFTWHSHAHEDEFFYVVKGRLSIELRGGNIVLEEGECVVIPKGVEHKPAAEEETWILLFEPVSTVNTGLEINAFTKTKLDRL